MSEAGRALIRVTWVWGSLLWRGVLCWHGLVCPPGGVTGPTGLEASGLWGLFGLLVSYLEKNKTKQIKKHSHAPPTLLPTGLLRKMKLDNRYEAFVKGKSLIYLQCESLGLLAS